MFRPKKVITMRLDEDLLKRLDWFKDEFHRFNRTAVITAIVEKALEDVDKHTLLNYLYDMYRKEGWVMTLRRKKLDFSTRSQSVE